MSNTKTSSLWRVASITGMVFFMYASPVFAANACQSNGTGGGSFNVVSTWINCGATTPQTVDSITIVSGDSVTLVAATNVAGVTIQSGGTLDANTRAFTDTDGYTNNGSHTGTTATMILKGIGSVIDGVGSYTPTGIVTMNTGGKTIAADSILSFPRVTVTGVTVTNNSTAGFTVDTALAGTGELIQGSGAILNIGGTSALATLTATASGNTVKYTGIAAQVLKASTYENLTITSGNTVSNSSATTTIQSTGILSVTSGTLNLSTKDFTNNGATSIISGTISDSSPTGIDIFEGLVTVGPAGIWTDGGNSAYTFRGGISNNGSFTSGTGMYTFDTNAQNIGGTNAVSISTLTITGVIVTNTNVAGLTIGTALAGTGTLKQGTSTILNLGGTIDSITLDASATPNDVHYTSTTANQNIATSTYVNLFINKSGRVGTLVGAITVNGDLSVTAGTLADGGFQITGNTIGLFSLVAGTTLTLGTVTTATTFPSLFTTTNISLATTSTVNYNSNLAQTISSSPTYGNLTTTATGAVVKTALGATTVNGLFTNGANNIFADGGFTITLKDGVTMTGTSTGIGRILFSGGSAIHSITSTGQFGNVELDDSYGVIQTSGTANIAGDLTVTTGIWDVNGKSTTVTGTTTVNSTLTLESSGGSKTFGDLIVGTTGNINSTSASAVAVNGNLTVNGAGTITGTVGVWTFQKIGGGTIGGTASPVSILGTVTFATPYILPSLFTVNTFSVSTGVNETNAGTTTVNTALSGAGTFTQGVGTVLNLKGSVAVGVLDASANPNEVHYISTTATQVMKAATYYNLFIDKTSQKATASGTTTVLGNVTVTSGTYNLASSATSITGTTDIFGTITDTSGGGAGGGTVFQGPVIMRSGAHWVGVVGEVCDFHFRNGLAMDGASFVSSTGVYYFEMNNQSITGSSSFTIDNFTVNDAQLTNGSGGTLTVRNALSGNGEFIQGSSSTLNIASTSPITVLTAGASSNIVAYTGTALQIVHAGSYQTLDVSGNTSNNVNLAGDTTINTALTLGATLVSASSSKIILGTSVPVSRTSGYVFGTIEKDFGASTSTTFTFDIGDGVAYTPIDVTLAGITGSGSIDGSVTNSDHADIGNSGINETKSVNRFWTLINNGLVVSAYMPVFHFAADDVDVGATTTNMRVAKRTSSVWNIVPSVCSVVTCSLSELSSMSDFQIGESVDETPPTVVLTSVQTSPTAATTINMTATWSEPVTGFTLGGVTISNGSAGNFVPVSSSVYTFDIVSPVDGTTITAFVVASTTYDAALNYNATSTEYSVLSDQTVHVVPVVLSTGGSRGFLSGFGNLLTSFLGILHTASTTNVALVPLYTAPVPSLPNTGKTLSAALFDVISEPISPTPPNPIIFIIIAIIFEVSIMWAILFIVRRVRVRCRKKSKTEEDMGV